MDAKVFGQFIARTRKEKNMTQADLAEIIGVTDKAVSRWERGVGFPDINTLEPLARALDVSILELMRSEKSEMENRNNTLSESEVTEMMANAVEMEREKQRQKKVAARLGEIVTVVTAIIVKLSSPASIGGALFCGAVVGLAAVGTYYFVRNPNDKESRKIYGFFMMLGIAGCIILLYVMGVNSYTMAWGVCCIFGLVIGIISR